ncbi:hypothetical protein [Cryobacterium zhongshanensis]|uniref:Uncharacterized protein n=1 Tax=Cryobacterium zhongshanensis TaxID=2928153 RepID=A0AA41UGH5_9MICO|nr:hypothetical protein [Cryobacterium zhongshanensis]MCI4659753.1 hypothetical protein [Cryobacterium zhongshanensis]
MTEHITCHNTGCKRSAATDQLYCSIDCASVDAWRVRRSPVTAANTPTAATRPLEPGDRVMIRRDLDHPAWKTQVESDPRDGGYAWVANPEIEEEIGVGTIVRSHLRPKSGEVLVDNGFWYDIATGVQSNSGATRVTRLTK